MAALLLNLTPFAGILLIGAVWVIGHHLTREAGQ